MSIKMWYYKHFNEERLLEELSRPAEGEYVAVKEGDMVTRVRKEDLDAYLELSKMRENIIKK